MWQIDLQPAAKAADQDLLAVRERSIPRTGSLPDGCGRESGVAVNAAVASGSCLLKFPGQRLKCMKTMPVESTAKA